MNWLALAILAYFILAFVNILDKFLLDKALPSSRAYTFLVGVLGLVVFLLAPWFLNWPGTSLLLFNLLVGAFFPLALLLFYYALKEGEASKVLLLIGGLVPVFTLVFSVSFLGETFNQWQWLALILLLIGTFLISWIPEQKDRWKKVLIKIKFKKQEKFKAILVSIGAALFFALFFVGNKHAFNHQEFMSAFIWMRGGSFLFVLLLLVHQDSRKRIIKSIKKMKQKKAGIFVFNQGLSASGFFLQNLAISLHSVALVSALQGVQYVFIIVLGVISTLFFPKIIKENITKNIILQKTFAVLFIALGLYFLSK
ncbi:MAG: DMT family transporter [Candidatus Pacebacteria bacterium]|nr:DMT family transporter [Candidatus Paceibacterota bacterium]